ncbi:MAG: EscU/YscU/HrcU family type III secretion system export apparatus switch protein [Acetivibrio sp.]
MEDNKTKIQRKTAVALSYDPDDAAPRLVASGRGLIADRIIDTAAKASVPIHKDEKLAGTLSKLEIGEFIPPELYNIVAEVLIYVDDMEQLKEKINRNRP